MGKHKWVDTPKKTKRMSLSPVRGKRKKVTHLREGDSAKCKQYGDIEFSDEPSCKACLNGPKRPPDIKVDTKLFRNRISRKQAI